MNDRPVIAFTVCDRPAYLAWVLESWREVRGIADAHLIFRCEPGCDEAVALAGQSTSPRRPSPSTRSATACSATRGTP